MGVCPGREQSAETSQSDESLDGFWGTLTEPQREGIEAVAMDMWDPCVASVRAHVAEDDQKIVYDKFHVA
jgi:transposase